MMLTLNIRVVLSRDIFCSVSSILLMNEMLLLGRCAAFGTLSEVQGVIFGRCARGSGVRNMPSVQAQQGHSLSSKDRHDSRSLPLGARTSKKIIGGEK